MAFFISTTHCILHIVVIRHASCQWIAIGHGYSYNWQLKNQGKAKSRKSDFGGGGNEASFGVCY